MAIKISQYKGIEVTAPMLKITEENIEEQITTLLSQNPKRVEKEGAIEMGDTARIDYEGFKDGVPFQGGKAEGYELGIGSHSFIPGFEEQMVGMAKGETRDLHLTFPEQYHSAELAGAEVVFTVTVHEIFFMEPAELNDEFAASFRAPGVNTVEDLKNYIRSSMQEQAERQSREMAAQSVMMALIENIEADTDQAAVDAAVEGQINQIRMQLMQQGAALEQYLQMTGMTMEQLKEQLTDGAVQQVKMEMGLLEIGRLENIVVPNGEIEDHYKQISLSYNIPVEEVKKEISADDLAKDILCRRAHEIVMNTAKITFTED